MYLVTVKTFIKIDEAKRKISKGYYFCCKIVRFYSQRQLSQFSIIAVRFVTDAKKEEIIFFCI